MANRVTAVSIELRQGDLLLSRCAQWANLDQCTLTERGLTTPAMVRKKKPKPTDQGAELEPATVPASGRQLSRLPLDVESIVVRPERRGTMVESPDLSPPGHAHWLWADVASVAGEGSHPVVLWFPEHVGSLDKSTDYRITAPAWTEMGRAGEARWHLCGQGLTPVGNTEPIMPEDLREPDDTREPSATEAPVADPASTSGQEPTAGAEDQPVGSEGQSERPRLPVEGTRQAEYEDILAGLVADQPRPVPASDHAGEAAGPGPDGSSAFDAWEALGERWLILCLADTFSQWFFPESRRVELKWTLAARDRVLSLMATWPEFAEAVDRSEERNGEGLVLRTLGELAFRGHEDIVRSLVEQARGELFSTMRWQQIGWSDFLVEQLGAEHFTVRCTEISSGRRGFHVVIEDDRGRTAEWRADKERSAHIAAARSFAEQHLLRSFDSWPLSGARRRPEGVNPWSVPAEGTGHTGLDRVRKTLRGLGLSAREAERVLQGAGTRLNSLVEDEQPKSEDALVTYATALGELFQVHAHATGMVVSVAGQESGSEPFPMGLSASDLLHDQAWRDMVSWRIRGVRPEEVPNQWIEEQLVRMVKVLVASGRVGRR